MIPSNEQNDIINNIIDYNLLIDSVAGSGKTTTVIYIAKKIKGNILLLTYNTKLRLETKERIDKLNLNVEVHTYHSFCVRYYDKNCINDTGIINLLNDTGDNILLGNFFYDLIILDEAQDINKTYYKLIKKIYSDNRNDSKLCFLGDRNQSIYKFNGADERFLTMANKIFNLNKIDWMVKKLSQSFRITDKMCDFINYVLKEDRITSVKKSNHKPRYIICNSFKEDKCNKVVEEILMYKKLGYKNDDFFILAPSIKTIISPIRICANIISKMDIPVYVPISDEEKINSDVSRNKIVFSTFHQVKGLERKVVIVFGFDSSYFDYYAKDDDKDICSNTLYVSLTRATDRLTIIHHNSNSYLNFIDEKGLLKITDLIIEDKLNIYKKSQCKTDSYGVVKLISHLPSDAIYNIMNYFDIVNKSEKGKEIEIKPTVKQKYGYENVSEITGLAIPLYYEYIHNNKSLERYIKLSKFNTYIDKDDITYNIRDITTIDNTSILQIASCYSSSMSAYIYKTKQINDYSWLSKDSLEEAICRLNSLNIVNGSYEYYVHSKIDDIYIDGSIDCIYGKNIYEFKCTGSLSNEHYIQLAIYMYLYEKSSTKNKYKKDSLIDIKAGDIVKYNEIRTGIVTKDMKIKDHIIGNIREIFVINYKKNYKEKLQYPEKLQNKYYLFNILTGECNEVKSTYSRLEKMIKYILLTKQNKHIKIDSDLFIDSLLV